MLANTTDELLTLIRADLRDPITDEDGGDYGCLWSNAEMDAYLTEAANMLAADTATLQRELEVVVPAGADSVALPPYIRELRSVRSSNGYHVPQLNADVVYTLRRSSPGQGPVTGYMRDQAMGRLLFNRQVAHDTTLTLQFVMVPGLPISRGMLLPFRDIEDQVLLMHYVKMRAYMKDDVETASPEREAKFRALYTDGAKRRKTNLLNQRRKPGQVKMEW